MESARVLLRDCSAKENDLRTKMAIEQAIADVDARRTAIAVQQPEYRVQRKLAAGASVWGDFVRSIFETEGVPLTRWPTPNEDGTVSGVPRVPGLGTRRTRRSTKGTIPDLSDLRPTIGYRVRGADTIMGELDVAAQQKYHGRLCKLEPRQLLNELYKTRDARGFGDEMAGRGVTQAPLTILTMKANARL